MKRIAIPLSVSKTQYYINQAYVDYVREAGMLPVLIPQVDSEELWHHMKDVEGVLLPGGIDLDPIYYGDDNFSSFSVEPEKDEFERALFDYALAEELPVFGICRGFQLIAREYIARVEGAFEFMEFTTHISGHNQVNDQQLSRTITQHFVDVAPGILYTEDDLKDLKRMPVNSMHHQGLLVNFRKKSVIGVGDFRMAAWTRRGIKIDVKVKDSYPLLCEAFRILNWPSRILAVQWHPEELRDTTLIRNFFEVEDESLSAGA
jgi:putative glutamine amidotransferase